MRSWRWVVALPTLATTQEVYRQTDSLGLGGTDFAAVSDINSGEKGMTQTDLI